MKLHSISDSRTALRVITLVALGVLAAGCGTYSTPPMGDSYHTVFNNQKAYPDQPSTTLYPGLDGANGEGVLQSYRATVGESDSIGDQITINIGDNN
jgi:hypothetical protein